MSSSSGSRSELNLSGLEILRVAALIGFFFAQLYLGSLKAKQPTHYCLTKPFWLDEFHTVALVRENRADQLLVKLSQGGDFNPPGLHLTLWLVSKLTDLPDELLLRSFSCAVGLGGLIATYFLLRIRFPWEVSWVSVLGMWSSSPLLIYQMFEGRFYSFWFTTVVLLCLLLSIRTQSVWQFVGVAAVAAIMCSVHYFGIISLGIVGVSHILFNFRDIRQRWLITSAFAAGAITLIILLPIYLGQRAALQVPTWIAPRTLTASVEFINEFNLSYAMTLPVFAYAFQQLLGRGAQSSSSENDLNFKTYAGTCGTILLPIAIVVFSYLIQPAQITRYALPAVLAYAPLLALTCDRLNRGVLAGTALLFFVIGTISTVDVYRSRPDHRKAVSIVSESSASRPLIVHSRVIAYPLFRYSGADSKVLRISFVNRGDSLGRIDKVEQAVARRMAELFDLPKTIEPDELASLDEFYLLANPGEEKQYEGWTAEPLDVIDGELRGYKMRRSLSPVH